MSKQTAVEWLINELGEYFPHEIGGIHLMVDKAKEMEKEHIFNVLKINRVEVIQHSEPYNGRAYVNNNAKDVDIQFQDNNETLKIFLK